MWWMLINRRTATHTLSKRRTTVQRRIARWVQQQTSAGRSYTYGRLSLNEWWKSPFPVRHSRNGRSDVDIRHRPGDVSGIRQDLTKARDTRRTQRGWPVATPHGRKRTVRATAVALESVETATTILRKNRSEPPLGSVVLMKTASLGTQTALKLHTRARSPVVRSATIISTKMSTATNCYYQLFRTAAVVAAVCWRRSEESVMAGRRRRCCCCWCCGRR